MGGEKHGCNGRINPFTTTKMEAENRSRILKSKAALKGECNPRMHCTNLKYTKVNTKVPSWENDKTDEIKHKNKNKHYL